MNHSEGRRVVMVSFPLSVKVARIEGLQIKGVRIFHIASEGLTGEAKNHSISFKAMNLN